MAKTKSSHSTTYTATKGQTTCCSTTKTNTHGSPLHKIKNLKTRKERNQLHGGEKGKSRPHCNRKASSMKSHSSHIYSQAPFSKKSCPIANPVLSQRQTAITTRRLTSIQGLFSHAVRSLDIERGVSEQMKRKKQKEEQSSLETTSASPQTCVLNEIQESESCSGTMSKASTREELTANRRCKVPVMSSKDKNNRIDIACKELPTRSASRKSPSSTKEPATVLSSSEKERGFEVCVISDDSEREFDAGNQEQSFSPTSESAPARPRLQNQDVSETNSNFSLTYMTPPSKIISGVSLFREQTEQDNQQPEYKEAVKNLTTHFYQTAEKSFPGFQPSLLAWTKEILQQALRKKHGFLLENNFSRLSSHLYGNQTATHFNSDSTNEDTPVLMNKCSKHRTPNMTRQPENLQQQDYSNRDFCLDSEVGEILTMSRTEDCTIVSSSLCLKEPKQSHTAQFHQWRSLPHPRFQLFNQDPDFNQHPDGLHWLETQNPNPQYSHRIGEGTSNRGFGSFDHSQRWGQNTDLTLNSGLTHLRMKPSQHDVPFEGSIFSSNLLQSQDDNERYGTSSVSAFSDSFRDEPHFYFPHPANCQHRPDKSGVTPYLRFNSQFTARDFYNPF